MSRHSSGIKVDIAEKEPVGVVITVKSLSHYNSTQHKLYVQIRNDTNFNHQNKNNPNEINLNKTKIIQPTTGEWNEDFYYNNSQMVDDNITFILRLENQTEIGKATIKNLSLRDPHDTVRITKAIDLLKDDQSIATLNIQISFYQRQDLIGGVVMPSLSLRPPQDFKHSYNVIESYVPKFSNKKGQKANCFNFCDGYFQGERIAGFDNMEMFPGKFKQKNVPKKS